MMMMGVEELTEHGRHVGRVPSMGNVQLTPRVARNAQLTLLVHGEGLS